MRELDANICDVLAIVWPSCPHGSNREEYIVGEEWEKAKLLLDQLNTYHHNLAELTNPFVYRIPNTQKQYSMNMLLNGRPIASSSNTSQPSASLIVKNVVHASSNESLEGRNSYATQDIMINLDGSRVEDLSFSSLNTASSCQNVDASDCFDGFAFAHSNRLKEKFREIFSFGSFSTQSA